MIASKLATRKPPPKNMIPSIMNATPAFRPNSKPESKASETAPNSHGCAASSTTTPPSPSPSRRGCRSQSATGLGPVRARGGRPRSERIPGRLRREFQIADICPQSQPDTRSDRHQHNIICRQRCHPEAAYKIGRPGDAGKSLVDRLGRREAVDQHHGPRALAAEIPSERRPLPEHLEITGILGIEHAFAIAQAAEKGAPGLLAKHVSIGQAPLRDRLFDQGGEAARDGAEKAMAGIDQFAGGKTRWLLGGRRSRLDRLGQHWVRP